MSALAQQMMLMAKASALSVVTLNPADKDPALTLSGGNLIVTRTGGAGQGFVRTTLGFASGKIYWEVVSLIDGVNDRALAAFCLASVSNTVFPAVPNQGYVYDGLDGSCYDPTHQFDNAGAYVAGDVIMIALDIGGGNLWFGKNGVWFNSVGAPVDPAIGLRPMKTGIASGPWFPCVDIFDTSASAKIMLSAADQTYAAPAGFSPVSA